MPVPLVRVRGGGLPVPDGAVPQFYRRLSAISGGLLHVLGEQGLQQFAFRPYGLGGLRLQRRPQFRPERQEAPHRRHDFSGKSLPGAPIRPVELRAAFEALLSLSEIGAQIVGGSPVRHGLVGGGGQRPQEPVHTAGEEVIGILDGASADHRLGVHQHPERSRFE